MIFYAKGGDGSGAVYTESLDNPALAIKGNNAVWENISAPVFVEKSTDLKGVPHLYAVAATILKFLKVTIPVNYDGQSLINF